MRSGGDPDATAGMSTGPGSNGRPRAGGRRGPPAPDELVHAVRAVVGSHADWSEMARLVAGELRPHLPGPDVLPPDLRAGDPAGYRSHVLHCAPDGSFSIVRRRELGSLDDVARLGLVRRTRAATGRRLASPARSQSGLAHDNPDRSVRGA